jgi:serine/threonine protein kinase
MTAQIGEGGMGQMYSARDTKLGRDVAIKILPDAGLDSERIHAMNAYGLPSRKHVDPFANRIGMR